MAGKIRSSKLSRPAVACGPCEWRRPRSNKLSGLFPALTRQTLYPTETYSMSITVLYRTSTFRRNNWAVWTMTAAPPIYRPCSSTSGSQAESFRLYLGERKTHDPSHRRNLKCRLFLLEPLRRYEAGFTPILLQVAHLEVDNQASCVAGPKKTSCSLPSSDLPSPSYINTVQFWR